MLGLIRSASLTNYAEVARKAGLDPQRMLTEFGLPARCLREPELKVPIDAVRGLLEASAERSGDRGLRASDGRGAAAFEPRPARAPDPRAADAAPRRRDARALRQSVERGAVPDRRGQRRGRRAARGADRRRLRPDPAVDRARDRRRLSRLARLPRLRLAAAARLLRPRRAGRPLGARAGIRPQRRVRPRFQRHRLRAQRSRGAQSAMPIPASREWRDRCSMRRRPAAPPMSPRRSASWS